SILQRIERTEETAAPMQRMPVEILFSDRSALPAAQPLVNGSAWSAWIKFDLAERGLVVGHVLLQERHERLGLLRAQINSLKVSQFHLRLRALLHRGENEEEIPDIHPDLHAVGVGFAVIGGLHELHIRLVPCIHVSQCNAGQSTEQSTEQSTGQSTEQSAENAILETFA